MTDWNKQVAELLKVANPPEALLLVAADRVRPERVLKAFCRHFLCNDDPNQAPPEGALTRYKATQLTGDQILALQTEVSSLSLFSKQRFIIIDDCESLGSSSAKTLATIVRTPPPQMSFFLTATSLTKCSAPLVKQLQSKKQLIQFTNLTEPVRGNWHAESERQNQLRNWIAREMKRVGITTAPRALSDQLIEAAGTDLDNIAKMIAHLALYSSDGCVNVEDIAILFNQASLSSEFNFVDLVIKGQQIEAEILIEQLLKGGTNPFALLGLLQRSLMDCLQIKILQTAGVSASQIQSRLGLAKFKYNMKCKVAETCSATRLRHLLAATVKADSKLKNISLGDKSIYSELIATRNLG